MKKQLEKFKKNVSKMSETLQTGKLLGHLVWKSGPWLMVCIIFFIVIEATIPLVQLYASKIIVDGITSQDNMGSIEVWAIIYAISLVLISSIKSIETWVKTLLSERSMMTINCLLLDSFNRIPGMRFFEDPKYRDRLETLRDRSTWLPFQFINISSNLFTAVASLIGVIAIIAYLSPLLAVLLFVSTAPFAFVHNHYNQMEWEYHKEYAPVKRRISYTRNLLLNRRPAKEIRLFGLGEFFLKTYRSSFKNSYQVLRKIQVSSSRWAILSGFLSGAVTGIGYFWILSQSGSQTFSIGDVALYLGAVLQLSVSLREIAREGADTIDIWRMGKDFFLFMNAEKDIESPSEAKSLNLTEPVSIEFKNVSFSYPFQELIVEVEEDSDDELEEDFDLEEDYEEEDDKVIVDEVEPRNILQNINFSISPGERIAIVGANGSGKTTLIKLLCRFYEFNEGEININGVSIRNLDIEQLRKQISVVFQEFGRYELTLKDNIALGDIETRNSNEQIKNAIESSKLEQIIESLPEGLETIIGPEWGGTDFSGGQWQRIALARAFMKEAGLVILDEPTASLDIRAEYEIFNQFNKFTEGKTVIMISHRFSTVKMADRILVLKEGRIVEEGSHEELMDRDGEYAKMFYLQAKSFQGKDEAYC